MSVELRHVNGRTECDWGTFETPTITWYADTNSATVRDASPLILVSKELVNDPRHFAIGPADGEVFTTYVTEDRRFMRIAASNGTWVWELFEAHWHDLSVCTVYVGRFPD